MFVPMNSLRKAYMASERPTPLHKESEPKPMRVDSGMYHPRKINMRKSYHGLMSSSRPLGR